MLPVRLYPKGDVSYPPLSVYWKMFGGRVGHDGCKQTLPCTFHLAQALQKLYQEQVPMTKRTDTLARKTRDMEAWNKVREDTRPFSIQQCLYHTLPPSARSRVLRRLRPSDARVLFYASYPRCTA